MGPHPFDTHLEEKLARVRQANVRHFLGAAAVLTPTRVPAEGEGSQSHSTLPQAQRIASHRIARKEDARGGPDNVQLLYAPGVSYTDCTTFCCFSTCACRVNFVIDEITSNDSRVPRSSGRNAFARHAIQANTNPEIAAPSSRGNIFTAQ